jgi:alanine racemase
MPWRGCAKASAVPELSRASCLVDLHAIRSNVAALRARTGDAQLCAVVKADGYGHGMVPAARAALDGGASWLAVAYPDEAVALRAAGIGAPVIALVGLPGTDLSAAVRAGVDLGVGSLPVLARAVAAARSVGVAARVHLEVDTGLGRGGATVAQWPGLVTAAARAVAEGTLEVVGVWSHLACGETPDSPLTRSQLAAFAGAAGYAEREGLRPALRHLLNSGGLATAPEGRYDLVRAGIACYGLSPGGQLGNAGLRPAMTLQSTVALTKPVGAGSGVSYGHRYRTTADTTLALVPVGYGDGVPRAAGGRVEVLLGGERRRIAGTVCMDQFMVDVGRAPVAEGDPVLLFGPGDAGEPTADEWAGALDTVGYEIVTRMGARVPRVYRGGGQ